MNGFVTESLSKIIDGFGNALKLLVVYAVTTYLMIPVKGIFLKQGEFIYILLLLAAAAFELHRSLAVRTSDQKRAWKGMAAGLLFWQVMRFTVQLGTFPLFQGPGILFWVMNVLIVAVLWKKILPIGAKTAMSVFLACWLEKLYMTSLESISSWPPLVIVAYESIRYLAAAAGVFALLYIIYKSKGPEDRSFAAIIVFASVLFLLLVI